MFLATLLSCGLASWILVPRWGMYGAAVALIVSAFTQLAGSFTVVFGAVRRARSPRLIDGRRGPDVRDRGLGLNKGKAPMSETESTISLEEAPESANSNLIGSGQWNTQWAASHGPRRLRAWRDYVSWRFARLFREYIRPGDRVLEIGCGGSRFLPYFARELGAEVWGLDFAPAGVSNAKAALERAGVRGTIIEGDLFNTTDIPEEHFDVVFSGGFIEHFTDTADVLTRMVRFAKRGSGIVITEIPNFLGLNGKIQEKVDPQFYRQHVCLSPSAMDEAHRAAGAATVRSACYFGGLGLGAINLSRKLSRLPTPLAGVVARALEVPQFILTAPLWAMRLELDSTVTSPYLLGVYRRVAGQ